MSDLETIHQALNNDQFTGAKVYIQEYGIDTVLVDYMDHLSDYMDCPETELEQLQLFCRALSDVISSEGK